MACVGDVAVTLVRCDVLEDGSDSSPKCLPDSFLGCSHEQLEHGDGPLDGVEIRTVGRREGQHGALAIDGGARAGALAFGNVVRDHVVAWLQGRGEDLPDIGLEDEAVDRPVDDHWPHDSVDGQRRRSRPTCGTGRKAPCRPGGCPRVTPADRQDRENLQFTSNRTLNLRRLHTSVRRTCRFLPWP